MTLLALIQIAMIVALAIVPFLVFGPTMGIYAITVACGHIMGVLLETLFIRRRP